MKYNKLFLSHDCRDVTLPQSFQMNSVINHNQEEVKGRFALATRLAFLPVCSKLNTWPIYIISCLFKNIYLSLIHWQQNDPRHWEQPNFLSSVSYKHIYYVFFNYSNSNPWLLTHKSRWGLWFLSLEFQCSQQPLIHHH